MSDDLATAGDIATAHIGDDIFPEFSAEIVGLDTGSRFVPVRHSIVWALADGPES